ncbi:uncharacterized protein LOC101448318 isoform X3 [Ceratitis capitata]|nr:uncharacterized protein LOC101448318 isoform X3 [Ceratitis capitata]XP_020717473.1 uncharacterized protein LOC101448318 isoform X3 [Ceratitis capitata]
MNSPCSSDEETLSPHHAMDIIKGHFLKDFDVRDIWSYTHNIFTESERQYITATLQCDDPCTQRPSTDTQEILGEEQVSRLFAVLRNKDYSEICKFMEALSYDYLWLVNLFENVNKIDYGNYVDLLHSLHSKASLKYEDYHVHRSMPFRKLRKALLNIPFNGRVVLASDFGCGKKWLAIDACTDYDVAKSMNFQIYWIDMSECTSSLEDLRMLRYLKLLLTESLRSPSPASYGSLDRSEPNTHAYRNSIDEIKLSVSKELKKTENKKCLVVLVNVGNTYALKAFDLPCKLLVITRNKKVSDSFDKKRSTTLRLTSGLTRAEMHMLFEKYLEHRNIEEKYVDLIYTHSNGHPYLLSLIGQSLSQNLGNWQGWIEKLRETKLVDEKFNAAIEKSLDSLEPELRKTFCTVFRCFPHAIFVPQQLIAALWFDDKCVKDLANDDICYKLPFIYDRSIYDKCVKDLAKLHRHGFLEKCISPNDDICYKLPFIYDKMLGRYEATQVDGVYVYMHRKLLAYYHFVEDLEARKEVLPFNRDIHDVYFFLCVGYHLKKAKLVEYFPQIYLDYGFLEQKIRNVDMLSTIADLETFQEYIAPDLESYKVFRAIRDFLPNIEKTLQESQHATLLQCALMEDGLVGIEARKQAAVFPGFTWFEHHGCIHQRSNIISLPSIPKKILLLDQKRSLVALEQRADILLINLSLDWNTYSVKLKNTVKGKSTVIDIRFFKDNNASILLALYDNGNMKAWCIPGDCTVDRRRSDSFSRPQEKEIEHRNVIPPSHLLQPITAFELSFGAIGHPPIIYLAYKSGDIKHLKWNSESKTFESALIETLNTKMQDICILRFVFNRNYIVCTKDGDIAVFDVIDYSNSRGIEKFKHFVESIETTRNEVLLICRRCIVSFTSRSIIDNKPVEYILHEDNLIADDRDNVINCAKLLHINGHKQLALGTKKGLIVFDIETRTKLLTTNVNEDITCVDIYLLDALKNKYMVACGSHAYKFLNLFVLRADDNGKQVIRWLRGSKSSRKRDSWRVDMVDLQMPPYVALKGGHLFALQYVRDEAVLLAVDSQNQVHKIAYGNNELYEPISSPITAITLYGTQAFVGCANGQLFDMSGHTPQPILTAFDQSIEFLRLLNEQTLIVADEAEVLIYTNINYGQFKRFALNSEKIVRCFILPPERIVLVFENRTFWVLDSCGSLIFKYVPEIRSVIGDCDLQNKQLFVVAQSYKIEVFNLADSLAPKIPELTHFGAFKAKVSCVAVSRNANMIAVACYDSDNNGEKDISIHVYECQLLVRRIELLYDLKGHSLPINAMRFSPNAYVLVSCAEQMCWWSMQMAACKLNNSISDAKGSSEMDNSRFHSDSEDDDDDDFDESDDRRISRYLPANILEEVSLQSRNDTRPTPDVTPVDEVCADAIAVADDSIWKTKRGPDTYCELLSCIKFNGTEAQQFFTNDAFTKFQTIDNSGSYYVLSLRDFSVPEGVYEKEYIESADVVT